ncbi:hypothetical protein [Nonomuraea dietziae]|uniref:hypothetical protein n=1 Tax=Nonomuraea dietziae TaxID=65515 RepID=UPI0031DD12B7
MTRRHGRRAERLQMVAEPYGLASDVGVPVLGGRARDLRQWDEAVVLEEARSAGGDGRGRSAARPSGRRRRDR